MKAADLIIVDVDKDNLNDEDCDSFGDSRLAGLLRQHSQANFIFTIQVGSHSHLSGEQLANRLEDSLSSTLPKGFQIVTGPS